MMRQKINTMSQSCTRNGAIISQRQTRKKDYVVSGGRLKVSLLSKRSEPAFNRRTLSRLPRVIFLEFHILISWRDERRREDVMDREKKRAASL